MTRQEYDKFYGDRLLGLLTRAFGELQAVIDARQGGDVRLMDAGRLGGVLSSLIRDGYALRDEIYKNLVPDPIKPEVKNNGRSDQAKQQAAGG